MQKIKYLQSFELLTAILAMNPGNNADAGDKLRDLSHQLDLFFSDNLFAEVLDETGSKKMAGISSDDELIIQYKKLNLQYSNIEILTLEDRQLLYLCVTCWLQLLARPDSEKLLTAKILSIDQTFISIVDNFFNDKHDEVKQAGNDELIVLSPLAESEDNLEGNWIERNFPKDLSEKETFSYKKLAHPFKVLFLGKLKLFVIRGMKRKARMVKKGKEDIFGWQLIRPGDFIEVEGNIKIDYHDLKRRYLKFKYGNKLSLAADDISYSYIPGKGVAKFSLTIEGGELVGVIGSEGSGKSTVLKLLAGELHPPYGEIYINGHSLKKDLYHLKGMIGYVPEEDLLFDELTVAENLTYAARLYLGKTDYNTLLAKVNQMLTDLDLYGARNKIVGRIGDKNLQPGQRRLLNIALELIREPHILIVDNTALPLNHNDTAKILDILADYSFRGHIVITGITQTDTKSGLYFDQLFILDEGGYPVFFGKLNEAWELFQSLFKIKSTDLPGESPVALVNYISQVVNPALDTVGNRYKTSGELYELFIKRQKEKIVLPEGKKVLPENILNVPTLHRQFLIFSLRNFKAAFSRTREIINILLISPFVAVLLAIFMRVPSGQEYNFSVNPYIPAFFFVSYLFALLTGLIISANEIFRERNIIHKEKYLNISFFSYINSKLIYLFLITFIQACSFILISHLVLEIKGMAILHLMIFISCQIFGILLGLIFSGSFKLIENIYLRAIPLALLFHAIFGGGFIRFTDFPGNSKYSPLISDVSVVRWAYEATMVYQFRENDFMKPQYKFNRDIISGSTYVSDIIPILKNRMAYFETPGVNSYSAENNCRLIRTELYHVARHFDVFPYENLNNIYPEQLSSELVQDINDYIEYIQLYFYSLYESAHNSKNSYLNHISDSLGNNYLRELKQHYHNQYIENEVTGSNMYPEFETTDTYVMQLTNQIYQYPRSDFGRTWFYTPEKTIRGSEIDTVEFDISMIWLLNLLLYVLLVFDAFNMAGIRNKYNF